jgi:hypothetical protein
VKGEKRLATVSLMSHMELVAPVGLAKADPIRPSLTTILRGGFTSPGSLLCEFGGSVVNSSGRHDY